MENLTHSKRLLQCAWSPAEPSLIGWRGPLPDHDTEATLQCAASQEPDQFAYALLMDLLDAHISALHKKFSALKKPLLTQTNSTSAPTSMLQVSRLLESHPAPNAALFLSRHLQSLLGVAANVSQVFFPMRRTTSASAVPGAHAARCGHGRLGYSTLGNPTTDGVVQFKIEVPCLPVHALLALSTPTHGGMRLANRVETQAHQGLSATHLMQARCELHITVSTPAKALHLNKKQPFILGLNTFLQGKSGTPERHISLRKTLANHWKEALS